MNNIKKISDIVNPEPILVMDEGTPYYVSDDIYYTLVAIESDLKYKYNFPDKDPAIVSLRKIQEKILAIEEILKNANN